MDAFLGELSKVKLRKVERKEEKKRAAPDGELTEVLRESHELQSFSEWIILTKPH